MIAVGQTIGNYTITAKLGEGGMGVVYLAEHPIIGRKVAMKAIHPELSRNQEVISRFMTEAKSVNQIGNEHIVDINDFGTTAEGEFYFIMEFLQGESLADRLKRDKVLPAARALQIAAQFADALAASHDHGIIHRDLKPENIFLINKGATPDFVKVLDFGLAKLTQGEERVTHKTRTGSVMGTPYYMSPEQCEGKANIDHRSDLYALGVILFEMVTGKVPFGGEGYGEIIVKHITVKPPSPRAINPLLSPAHEAVILRALEKERENRFQSMQELRTAILDPAHYLTLAPPPPRRAGKTIMPGAVPSLIENQDLSGEVVFDGAGGEQGAVNPGSQPSTFRHGAGQVADDDEIPLERKSRTGLVIGVVVAAAVAGGAALFFKKGAAPTVATPAGAVAPPAIGPAVVEPPAARTAVIKFESRPEGAEVVRNDNGQVLGTTPFEREFPIGKEPIEFTFKKAGFDDLSTRLAPDEPRGALTPTLVAVRPTPTATANVDDKAGRSSSRPSSRTRSSSSSSSKPGRKPGGTARPPTDEDGVLEPSFK